MANAFVDKFKDFGLRHGEKVVVGVTAALFVAGAAMAFLRETLEMKPEELNASATSAQSNLQKRQPVQDVLAKLEKDGLVDPKFVAVVDNQIKNAIKPDAFKPRLEWVTPEPGAGLIRDMPELIAPTELAAFPGRGGILMYTLDDKGEKIHDAGEDAKGKKGKAGKKAERGEKPEDKRRREEEEEKRLKQFAGKAEADPKDKAKEEKIADADGGPWKEGPQGKRWVVITGVIDNEQLKKNYLLALKNPAVAYPNYKRIEVERRYRDSEGAWTTWASIDQDKNYAVLDNLPQLEAEVVPEAKRPAALVDPLPFLQAGYWTGVHVAKLVPAEVLEAPKKDVGSGPMGGGKGSMGSMMSMGSNSPGGDTAKAGPGPGSSSMMSMGGMSGGGSGSGPDMAGGEANFPKLDEKTLMIRSLDFTVDPDTSYQFRVRIVVVNPNKDHTDVNPGVDTVATELTGPWSEPTVPVTVPADISAYVQAPEAAARREDLVTFQVIKFDSKTGQTVVKNDGAGPGELIGEFGSIQIPSSEGGGPKSDNLDFNSRSIVLDTYGGAKRLPDIGLERNQFVLPALAMIVEPDGSVVIRDQAADKLDEVRDDMEANYKQGILDSGKKREAGSGGSRMSFGNSSMMGGSSPGQAKKKK